MLLKKMTSALIAAILIFQTLPFCPGIVTAKAEEADAIYVSVNGNDNASGSITEPLKTLDAARAKAQSTGRQTINIRGGYYYLGQKLSLTSADSGLTFCAYNGEKVVLGGAYAISGWSRETVNGVSAWVHFVPDDILPKGFSRLYKGAEALNRPRYPESGYFYVENTKDEDAYGDYTNDPNNIFKRHHAFYAAEGDLMDFYNITDIEFRVLHWWKDDLATILSYNSETRKAELSRASTMTIRPGNKYYLENVFEALNEPGEWYYDSSLRKVYYIPSPGDDIASLTLYAGITQQLVTLDGAQNVSFKNIEFYGTNACIPGENISSDISSQAGIDAKGAVELDNSSNISFTDCRFVALGETAVHFDRTNKYCAIEGCYFYNIGGNAVHIGEPYASTVTDSVSRNIRVNNCYIEKYGRYFANAVALINRYGNSCEFTNNEIHDGYYSAISVGWTWGYADTCCCNNTISGNLIYDIGQGWLSDMGGIYTLGKQPGTVVTNNVVFNVRADSAQGGYGGWGIYLDEGSSDILVKDNLSYNCGSQSFQIHYGQDNLITNNIWALSDYGAFVANRSEGTQLTATKNIFLTDNQPSYTNINNGIFADDSNIYYDYSTREAVTFSNMRDPDVASEGNPYVYYDREYAVSKGFLNNAVFEDPGFTDAAHGNFRLNSNAAADKVGFVMWDYSTAGSSKYGSSAMINYLPYAQKDYSSGLWAQYILARDKFNEVRSDPERTQADFEAARNKYSAALERMNSRSDVKSFYNTEGWDEYCVTCYDCTLTAYGVANSSSGRTRGTEYEDFDVKTTLDSIRAHIASFADTPCCDVYVDSSVYTDLSQTGITFASRINRVDASRCRLYANVTDGKYPVSADNPPQVGALGGQYINGNFYSVSRGFEDNPLLGYKGCYDYVLPSSRTLRNLDTGSFTLSGAVPEAGSSVKLRVQLITISRDIEDRPEYYYYCANNSIDLNIISVDKSSLRRYVNGLTGSSADFSAAYAQAEKVLSGDSFSQAQIDSAANALISAYEAENNVSLPRDISSLVSRITAAGALDPSAYTAYSYGRMLAALSAAAETAEDPASTAAQTASAYSALNTAIASLVNCTAENDEFAALNIDDCKLYQSESWHNYTVAREAVKELLYSNVDSTQEQRTAAFNKLREAKDALVSAENVYYDNRTWNIPNVAAAQTIVTLYGAAEGTNVNIGSAFDSFDNMATYYDGNLSAGSYNAKSTATAYVDRSLFSDLSQTNLRVSAYLKNHHGKSMRLYLGLVSMNDTAIHIGTGDYITINNNRYSTGRGSFSDPLVGFPGGYNATVRSPFTEGDGSTTKLYGPVPEKGQSISFNITPITILSSLQGDHTYLTNGYMNLTVHGVDKAALRTAVNTYSGSQSDGSYSQDKIQAFLTALQTAQNVLVHDSYSQPQIDAALSALESSRREMINSETFGFSLDAAGGTFSPNLAFIQKNNYMQYSSYPSHSGYRMEYTADGTVFTVQPGNTGQCYAFLPVRIISQPGETYRITAEIGTDKASFLVYNSAYSHGWDLFPNYYIPGSVSFEKTDGGYRYSALVTINGSESADESFLRIESNNTTEQFTLKNLCVTRVGFSAESFSASLSNGDTVTLPDAAREGYDFIGWFDTDGNAVTEATVTGATALHAEYEEIPDIAGADRANSVVYCPDPNTAASEFLEGLTLTGSGGSLEADSSLINTGSVVSVVKNGALRREYTVVVRGDVNGDGRRDGCDSVLARAVAAGMLNPVNAAAANRLAADVNGDLSFNEADAAALDSAGVFS